MIVAATTILGFLGGFITPLIDLWKQSKDQKHELEVMKLQADAQAAGHQQRLEEINTQADVESERLALEASKITVLGYTGTTWLDVPIVAVNTLLMFVNGLVRPVITYGFFWLYVMVKYAQYQIIFQEGTGRYQAILGIWGDNDQAIFGSVVGFWFGSRMSQRMKEKWRS